MTTIPAKNSPKQTSSSGESTIEVWKILLPYGLAILAQLPMLILYFRQLWARPHYQPFALAILATIGLALYRWPFGQKLPFHRSIAGDVLLVLGLVFATLGALFVEPWFSALSAMLVVTSLFARTLDKESLKTLWPCSLPLFVYLTLPDGLDIRLITTLQQYSAIYTSKLLDLAGLGHHMNGTVINVPNLGEYGIEQACSGVQSFFTLLLVAVVFIVMSRRLRVPNIGLGMLAVFMGILCLILRLTWLDLPYLREIFLILGVGLILFSAIGFRATALILSAVFWAVFMNTLRILLIPLAKYYLQLDWSHGISHDLLGYAVLALGIVMLFSTDQFLLFLFGPVETSSGESGPFGRVITKFWNRVVSGDEETDDNERSKRRRRGRQPIRNNGRIMIWAVTGLLVAIGLWQFVDVQRSLAASSDLQVRFFDVDVTMDFEKDDMPEFVDTWKQVKYESEDRSRASDLGERSDVWQFRAPNCAAIASLDQTFPGWHELTTCYTNTGWKLTDRKRRMPSYYLGEAGNDDRWSYIEATFERSTGEKGYLLFSHFDAFGQGLEAPEEWGSFNSFMIRASNRLSHRVRASLFRGQAYQTQVFLTSFNDLDDELKLEVNERYLKIRNLMRTKYVEKKKEGEEE